MSEHAFVTNVKIENFVQEVLEKSRQIPVLVDFWAAWCAPCQRLIPILHKLADEYAGKFCVAKVNSDEQQALAARYGVRSLPTLKLFHNGAVVEEVIGAQPESVLRQLIERYIEREGDQFHTKALALSAAGEHAQAIELMQQLKQIDPSYPNWDEEYAHVLIQAGRYTNAEAVLKALPANVQTQPAVQQALARLSFAKTLEDAPAASVLAAMLATDEHNLLARYQLSAYQVLQQDYPAALDNLLFIMRKDRSFNEDAGRKGLLAVFELLGNDPLVSRYRSKMSSLLY